MPLCVQWVQGWCLSLTETFPQTWGLPTQSRGCGPPSPQGLWPGLILTLGGREWPTRNWFASWSSDLGAYSLRVGKRAPWAIPKGVGSQLPKNKGRCPGGWGFICHWSAWHKSSRLLVIGRRRCCNEALLAWTIYLKNSSSGRTEWWLGLLPSEKEMPRGTLPQQAPIRLTLRHYVCKKGKKQRKETTEPYCRMFPLSHQGKSKASNLNNPERQIWRAQYIGHLLLYITSNIRSLSHQTLFRFWASQLVASYVDLFIIVAGCGVGNAKIP